MRVLNRLKLPLWIAITLGASPAAALTVYLEPDAGTVVVGQDVAIDVLADLDEPVLGFGIDLAFDSGLIGLLAAPVIGPAWLPVFAPDGDGLAGAGPTSGVMGDGVLLATLHFEAIGLGLSALTLGVTAGDLTEGFALVSGGSADPAFLGGEIEVVVPEPATAPLMALGLGGLGWIGRRRARRRPRSRLAARR